MGESEWKHAGWVSGLGKWAWIILLALGIIRILAELATVLVALPGWEAGRELAALLAIPYTVPHPIVLFIWPLLGGIISIIVSLFIIRPKFSKPCGAKDWEALYGWTLNLGGKNVPWMFIWGIIFVIFSWFYITGVFVMLPAIMLIWVGPRKYEW